jgi:dihydrofolate synthase / folylpolyglutamate synthase
MTIRFANEAEAITYIFQSLRQMRHTHPDIERQPDELSRDTTPTRRLLALRDLLATPREYAVVTGSKGKGSTTVITAKVLESLGHTVGMITSPHLVSYRERIRVNGLAIPEADLCRILSDLAPTIDEITAALPANAYFSPQGLFLAVALQWFTEQNVNVAVLEVGRGGRFDDIAVVPNALSMFTPIMLEHPHQLGGTVERIAWHKSGIIKPNSYAVSVPQATEVLDVIQREADAQNAEFAWISPLDMGQWIAQTENGLRMSLGRYGELDVSLRGRYQVENVTLAVQGAGNMHGRLNGIPHASAEYVQAIKHGVAHVRWPGRLQQLQASPAVFVDGAINAESARLMIRSLEGVLRDPVIAIVCVPDDKDYEGVYREIGIAAESMILTETTRNITLHFPPRDHALAIARRYNNDTQFIAALPDAVAEAKRRMQTEGTLLIVGTQSIVADTMLLWGLSYEQL